MSSLPNEVLEDVLQPLDRWTLDHIQFTNRRFLQLITHQMSDVCLREIHTAIFHASHEGVNTDATAAFIQIGGRPERRLPT
ncbi:hypothetical protein AAVH_30640 [Aphelenchoides avenae]|nr:hypothetical protein AAVH_30640 [Aphelenchus avenae]